MFFWSKNRFEIRVLGATLLLLSENYFSDDHKMGASFSTNVSEQEAISDVTQSYAGTCDVVCNNNINDVDIAIVNSSVGGSITLSQVCSANLSCIQNSTQNSVSDVVFKAANSSNANPATWSTWVDPGQIVSSQNTSVQNIQQSVNNAVTQTCSSNSTNSMSDVQIFAQNSYIGGNIQIGQTGNAAASCNLQSQMVASAEATGTIENCSSSGKTLIPSCLMGKGSLWVAIGLIVGLALLGVVIFFLWKHFHVPVCTSVDQIGKIKCTPPPCGTPGFPTGKCTPVPSVPSTPSLASKILPSVPTASSIASSVI